MKYDYLTGLKNSKTDIWAKAIVVAICLGIGASMGVYLAFKLVIEKAL